jgi:hypothetical protein
LRRDQKRVQENVINMMPTPPGGGKRRIRSGPGGGIEMEIKPEKR